MVSGRRVAPRAVRAGGESGVTLRVDPVACDGIGMCAHLAPGLVGLDSWGYPVISQEPLGGRELRAARVSVSACPRRALFLTTRSS